MSSKISLWAGLIGIAATIPLVQTIACAKSSVEIGDTAKAITVLITEPNSVGSGVILQQQGDIYTVLTAAHVVKNKTSYKITTPDDRKYDIISSSIRTSPGNIDLAVVKFKSTTKYPTAKLGNCNLLKSGMDLYVSGFPAATRVLTQSVLVFREGKVSANSNKIFDAGYSLVYSNDTLPGMSGGAVLNSEGELVAIHGRGDREQSTDDKLGQKTGFNVGIPINRFATVASKMGVELGGQVAPVETDTVPKADDYIASAAQKDNEGNYRGALADYDRAIELNPNYAIAYNNRGKLKASWRLDDKQGALVDFNRAIQINSNYADAYQGRAELKQSIQDYQGALADFNRAIQLSPTSRNAYSGRANLKYWDFQDYQGAVADYNRVIQLDPNYSGYAYARRIFIKIEKLNDFQGALADYNRLIQLNPNYAEDYIDRGNLKANKLNDFQGALADYNRAILLDSKSGDPYYWRGILKYNRLNDKSGGIIDMKQAIKLFQKRSYGRQYEDAIEQLKKWHGS